MWEICYFYLRNYELAACRPAGVLSMRINLVNDPDYRIQWELVWCPISRCGSGLPQAREPSGRIRIENCSRVHVPVWKGLAAISQQVSFINLKSRAQKRRATPWYLGCRTCRWLESLLRVVTLCVIQEFESCRTCPCPWAVFAEHPNSRQSG